MKRADAIIKRMVAVALVMNDSMAVDRMAEKINMHGHRSIKMINGVVNYEY